MKPNDEAPRSRAYALVFAYRLALVSYGKARKGLLAAGLPDLMVDNALHAPSVRHLRTIIRWHIDAPPPAVVGGAVLRMPHLSA